MVWMSAGSSAGKPADAGAACQQHLQVQAEQDGGAAVLQGFFRADLSEAFRDPAPESLRHLKHRRLREKPLPAGHDAADVFRDVLRAEEDDVPPAGAGHVPGVMQGHRRNEDKVPGVQIVDAFVDQEPAGAAFRIVQLAAGMAVMSLHDEGGVPGSDVGVDAVVDVDEFALRGVHFVLQMVGFQYYDQIITVFQQKNK